MVDNNVKGGVNLKINNSLNYSNKIKKEISPCIIKSNDSKKFNYSNYDIAICETENVDYKNLTKLTLKNLKNTYKNINIYIGDFNSHNDIKNFAANSSNGKNLIISSEFLKKMESNSESYNNGKFVLEEVLKQLSNDLNNFDSIGAYIDEKGITFWNSYKKDKKETISNSSNDIMLEAMKNMQQDIDDMKNKLKIMKSKSVFNAPVEVYSKLAQARTVTEVKGVISNTRYRISKLKSMLRSCEENEIKKIKAAINQMEKAITRSYRKIRDLSQEDNIRLEKNKAENTNENKKAEKKNRELEKRRAIRRIRESAQMDEANPLYYYPQMLLNRKKDNFDDKDIPTYVPENVSLNASMPISTTADISSGSTVVNVLPTIEISL